MNGHSGMDKLPGLTDLPATIRWLVSRQVEYQADDDEDDNDEEDQLPLKKQRNALARIYKESTEPLSLNSLSLYENTFVGFNGRCNKKVDTCYVFWVTASLDARISSRVYAND